MVNSLMQLRVSITKVADKSCKNLRIILLDLGKILICSECRVLPYWARYRPNKLRVSGS
jgi:hypothetical protein